MAPLVTLPELLNFHKIDSIVYDRLVIELGFDSNIAKKVVAFWYFLEIQGYKDFMKNMIPLPHTLLEAFVMEAITCLACLNKEGFPIDCVDNHKTTPLMCCLVSQDFSLGVLYANREKTILWMERFLKDVCERVFSDVRPRNLGNGFQIQSVVPNAVESHVPYNPGGKVNGFHPQLVGGQENNAAHQHLPNVCHSDRTLFITFSKGHPISKTELRDLITRRFGNCVEAIHMRVEPQPLFARVVLNSASAMEKILGEKEYVQLSINGKDVRARRYVLKQDEQQHPQLQLQVSSRNGLI